MWKCWAADRLRACEENPPVAIEEDATIEEVEQLLERTVIPQIRGIALQLDEMKAALKRMHDTSWHMIQTVDRIEADMREFLSHRRAA
jgi:hypothetical protein